MRIPQEFLMFLALVLTSAMTPTAAPAPRLLGELVELKTPTGTLYGALDLPATTAPCPAVLLLGGSGPTDRDGNNPIMRNDHLKLLGRALASQGIAVLRIDKRGVAASGGAMSKEEDVRLDTFAADAVAWITMLRKDSRFTKVGMIGHSEGSLVGLLAAKDAKPEVFVSLCGPGRPFADLVREQMKASFPAEMYAASEPIIAELEAGRPVKDVPDKLKFIFRPSVQPYLLSLFKHDPAKLAAEYPSRLLVISGSTDIQVPTADGKRLAGDNSRARWVTIEGMNHILKPVATTDRAVQVPSYTDAALPLHPKLVGEVVAFLKPAVGEK
jgi:pimeloyl-ACP methyl ester carboxylesterase